MGLKSNKDNIAFSAYLCTIRTRWLLSPCIISIFNLLNCEKYNCEKYVKQSFLNKRVSLFRVVLDVFFPKKIGVGIFFKNIIIIFVYKQFNSNFNYLIYTW